MKHGDQALFHTGVFLTPDRKEMRAVPSGSRRHNRPAGFPEPRPLSLKRSVFLRMLLITLAAVLIFYVIGMTINQIGIRNVRSDIQDALEAHTRYVADQLDREMDRLKFFIQRIRLEPRIRVKIEELPE